MTAQYSQLTALAGLLADETRAAVCLALLDGRAWTAKEIARQVGVAVSTVSEHLTKLVEGGLLAEERHGRHRYRGARQGVSGGLPHRCGVHHVGVRPGP